MYRIVRVLAPNPGPFTLEGTNTWIVGAPAVVIDPGPLDDKHVEEVRRAAGTIKAILLTHRHPDHAPGAALLAERVGAPVLAFEAHGGEQPLADGDAISAGGGVTLTAIHTPGHTPDHVVFCLSETGALFTGDVVLGRGTSVIDPPEGNLAHYLESLSRLHALSPSVLYPGHGPVIWEGRQKLAEYIAHREDRERQVLDGLESRAQSPEELVPKIYSAYPRELHPIAARSVLAHLLKLEAEGRARRVGEKFTAVHEVPSARSPAAAKGGSSTE